MSETPDRRVHAEHGEKQVVRYDDAGVWCIEYVPNRYRPYRRIRVGEAARVAVEMAADGGTVYLGLSGGRVFDRKVLETPQP